MREIKYQAWDKKDKEMLQDIQDYFDCDGCANEYGQDMLNQGIQKFGDFIKSKRFEVREYTGLKDKNGKEIYEGDILEIDDKEHDSGPYSVQSIGWNGFYLNGDGHGSPQVMQWNLDGSPEPTTEVIGNIYENPELLEAKK